MHLSICLPIHPSSDRSSVFADQGRSWSSFLWSELPGFSRERRSHPQEQLLHQLQLQNRAEGRTNVLPPWSGGTRFLFALSRSCRLNSASSEVCSCPCRTEFVKYFCTMATLWSELETVRLRHRRRTTMTTATMCPSITTWMGTSWSAKQLQQVMKWSLKCHIETVASHQVASLHGWHAGEIKGGCPAGQQGAWWSSTRRKHILRRDAGPTIQQLNWLHQQRFHQEVSCSSCPLLSSPVLSCPLLSSGCDSVFHFWLCSSGKPILRWFSTCWRQRRTLTFLSTVLLPKNLSRSSALNRNTINKRFLHWNTHNCTQQQ